MCSWSNWWKCQKWLLTQGDTRGTDKWESLSKNLAYVTNNLDPLLQVLGLVSFIWPHASDSPAKHLAKKPPSAKGRGQYGRRLGKRQRKVLSTGLSLHLELWSEDSNPHAWSKKKKRQPTIFTSRLLRAHRKIFFSSCCCNS